MKNETFAVSPKGKKCKWAHCGKNVKFKDHAVLLGTFKDGEITDESWMHFNCYLDWMRKSINDRAQKIIDENIPKAFNAMMQGAPDIVKQVMNDNGIKKESQSHFG